MKKADKGCEGHIKATELKFSKFDDFFTSIRLLDVLYSLIWVVLSFKAKKVKKATVVAKKANLSSHLCRPFSFFLKCFIPKKVNGMKKCDI